MYSEIKTALCGKRNRIAEITKQSTINKGMKLYLMKDIQEDLIMRKNIADLVKIGILVPAMVISMVACGSSTTQNTSAEAAETKETTETTEAVETTETTETAAAATEPKVYENKGYKLTVPTELVDKITVTTPEENDDGILFDAVETKSYEAAKAAGNENDGAGWLFTITERDADTAHEMMTDGFGDQYPIAVTADGVYLIFNRPTDVRYERATPEEMQNDQAEWTAACEWASTVRNTFAQENGLTAISYNATMIEVSLANIAYGQNTDYTISTTEHGPIAPGSVDPLPFYEKLTTGAKYEFADLTDAETPDGEYIVLNCPDSGIRYDFFLMEGKENIIRMVTGTEGEEFSEAYYTVTFEDGTSKASSIMQEWYNALYEANGAQ